MTVTEYQNEAAKKFRLYEVVRLRDKKDLQKFQMVSRMQYKDYLNEKVMITKILKEETFDFYGVMLGGQIYFEIKTKDEKTFLIEPVQLIKI